MQFNGFHNYPLKFSLLTFLACFIFLVTWGQNGVQLTGYVVDEETREPIPYASVGVPELNKGISANINGYFQLSLTGIDDSYHLQISSIGYQRVSIAFSEITMGVEHTFTLKPVPTVLDEVVIVGKSRTLEELVKRTSKNRKVYLRSTPYLMNGFYREVLKTDNGYQGITEAHGILYMNGYNSGYKNTTQQLTFDLVQWKNIRRSNYPDEQTKYLEIAALLKAKDYYLHRGPLHRKYLDKFQYTVSDSSLYLDRLVLIVDFEPKQSYVNDFPYRGKMYIKEDDQALIRLEIQANGEESFLQTTKGANNISSKFEISFVEFEGQYYLNRAGYNRSYNNENGLKNWQLELIGESFSDQSAMFLNYSQRVVLFSEMLNPVVHYDPEFWKNFSFSQGSDFSKMSEMDATLERQFQENHGFRLTPLPEGVVSYEQMSSDRDALDFIMQR